MNRDHRTGAFAGCVGGMLLGMLVVVLPLGYRASRRSEADVPEPPKLAGQAVPRQAFKIDFQRRYHFYLNTGFGQVPAQGGDVYRNCRIVGFTGAPSDESVSNSSYYTDSFGAWLVVELPDRRLAYLQPSEIRAFEEAAPAAPTRP